MADADHLKRLLEGVKVWNAWREQEPSVRPVLCNADLHGADLRKANLHEADLRGANLIEANLGWADLSCANLGGAHLGWADLREAVLSKAVLKGDFHGANLSGANLREADLSGAALLRANLARADLSGANLSGADLSEGVVLIAAVLSEANLSQANLSEANLRGANLTRANLTEAYLSEADLTRAVLRNADLLGANLEYAQLSDADLTDADLTNCRVYGISSWGLTLSESTKQQDLVITPSSKPQITADDIEVAQFLYLLIDNKKIRKVLDTITSKVVLIIGRFSKERKVVLDAMRDELRRRDFLPVIFDFSIPSSRDVSETVKVLAGLSRFVIADITDATEVRAELQNIIKEFSSLPVQPILLHGQSEYVGLSHLKNFPWLLPAFLYDTEQHLLGNLDKSVIAPAEAKVRELRGPQDLRQKLC
jgi:uncharacterized protein YjbI with pentapeptide repeats